MRSALLFLLMALCFSDRLFAKSPLKIHVPANESEKDVRHNYDHKIIELLLSKTESEYGPFQLVPVRMTQFRAINDLKNGSVLNVMASVTSKQRERDLTALRYSIHKSLMGIRLLLIKKDRQAEFARITDVNDLKKLIAGQGADWPDVDVLRANGFHVNTGLDYDGLFRMLAAKRFDYFPRAVAEIYPELEAHKNAGFAVESTLALVYSQPAYIFVNKDDKALARRLEKGWQIAITDGSFEKLFLEKHGESLKKANLHNRRIFFLNNPYSTETNPDFSVLQAKF